MRWLVIISFCTVLFAPAAQAMDSLLEPARGSGAFKPALVYLSGSRESDKAFIEMARAGAERAKQELGITYEEYRLPSNEEMTHFLSRVAESGASPIIAVGFQNVLPVLNLADEYPDTHFTVIDGLVPPLFPNVQSIIFKDHEGAFLVGMIAAYTSKTHHIGFIGGMDVPLIRNFGLGYLQGAKFVNPTITIDLDMIGSTPEAWSSPESGYNLAKEQYGNGADVIFAAAGGSGQGVLRAAKDADKLAIGVDTNQNGLYPGHVLTSLVKRVDTAVFKVLKMGKEGQWRAGIKYLGVEEGALDYAVDQNNKRFITPELIEQVEAAKERIIRGFIEVEMYSPN